MTLRVLFSFIIIAVLGACFTPPKIAPSAAPSGAYKLDPTHASVVWRLSHAGLSQYTARFDTVSGALDFDPDAPENSRLDIRIDPASVSTGLPEFDQEIAYDSKYFNAERFPEIRFVSTKIITTDEQTGQVTGGLTFRGVTQPMTLDVTFNGAGKSFGNPGKTLGFSATGTLNRSDFGFTHLSAFGIGDAVTLRIEAEFNEVR